jgi:hypothetical protein
MSDAEPLSIGDPVLGYEGLLGGRPMLTPASDSSEQGQQR